MFVQGKPGSPLPRRLLRPAVRAGGRSWRAPHVPRTFGGRPNEADWDELVNQKITTAGTVYRFFSAVKPFTYMVLGGVFDRHPDLELVSEYPWLASTAMHSSDYPHSVTLWPHSRTYAEELTAGLSPEDTTKILSGNASRVYGL
jgi:Amidohydrolase